MGRKARGATKLRRAEKEGEAGEEEPSCYRGTRGADQVEQGTSRGKKPDKVTGHHRMEGAKILHFEASAVVRLTCFGDSQGHCI